MLIKLNDMHQAVLTDYMDGEFAYLIGSENHDSYVLIDHEHLPDTLLRFILIELSESEDCENVEMGIDRMSNAKDDLIVVLAALEKLQEALLEKQAAAQPA